MRTPKLLLFGGGGKKEYGMSWNQATDVITRTQNAVGLVRANFDKLYPFAYIKRCNLSDAGAVNAYYGDSGFATDGSNGQVMVEIPKFYYKFTHSATVHTPSVSREKLPGYTLHPAFVSNGVVRNKIYIGAFEASVFDVTAAATEINTIKVTAEPTGNGNMTITLDGNYAFTVAILDADSIEGVVDKIVAAGVKTDYQGVTWTPAKTASDTLTYTAGSSGLKTVVTMPTANGVTSTITKTVTGTGGYVKNDAGVVDFTATSGDKIASIAGVKPASGWKNSLTIVNARKLAVNRGAGWGLLNFNQASAIHMLYAIEYANLNSQSALSVGITQITDDATTNMGVNTGLTAGIGTGSSNLGNASGQVAISHYKTAQTTYPFSYRGIENIYGNLWKWIDGINIKANNNPWIADNGFVSDQFSAPYVDSGLTLPSSNGYASNLVYGAGLDYGFLPSAVAGSSSTYLADYYYQNTGNRVALLGGRWNDGTFAGAFLWYLYDAASYSSRTIGARAVFS